MPDDFVCIWKKERTVLQKSDRISGESYVEKLFTLNDINKTQIARSRLL